MIQECELRMKKAVDSAQGHLSVIRTGRANPSMLSKIQVEYYGTIVSLQQVASVTVPENMVLMLNIFDKAAVKDVERAIMTSDLNLTPMTEGSIIRLRLPELTEDRRKELVKLVRKQTEDGRVSVRNIRRDLLDKIKHQEKEKEVSEDESKRLHDHVQKMTDKYVEMIDQLSKDKESEIMTI